MTSTPPLALYRIDPPYDRFVPARDFKAFQKGRPGTVIAVGLEPNGMARELDARVLRLRRSFPSMPVVFRTGRMPQPMLLPLVRRCVALGVRAIVHHNEELLVSLRMQLAAPINLPDGILDWLLLRGLELQPRLASALRVTIGRARRGMTVNALARGLSTHASTLRGWFRNSSLPSPKRWLLFGETLLQALQLQRHPDRALAAAAYHLGYPDQPAMNRRFSDQFGVTPGTVQAILGWEWLAEAWLQRTVDPSLIEIATGLTGFDQASHTAGVLYM